MQFKNKYRQLKNVNNLDLLRQAGKDYKKEINKAFRKYKETIINKVRHLKSANSKEYWSIVNGKSPNKIINDISLEVLQVGLHFQKIE